MAISIDWPSGVISVPRADMTLTQSNPTEVRELDINQFRSDLRILEDTDEGRAFQQTHLHNPEATLQGITYARIFEILPPYSITFEDGNYAVNVTGGNSNLGDRVNLNAVSVRINNSAGLISNKQVEYASFNGGVTVDAINGKSGTIFPVGTPQEPVNNIQDAVLIAQFRGFNKLFIKGNFTFDTGDNIENFIIEGENSNKSLLTFNDGALTEGIDVFNCTIQGIFDDVATFENCRLLDIQFVQGYAYRCVLNGEFTLAGSGETLFLECWDGIVGTTVTSPSINFNGSGRSCAIRGYKGDITIKNKTGPEAVEINGASGGTVTIEDTVTAGIVRLSGSLQPKIETGVTATIDVSQVVYPDLQQLAAFEGHVYINVSSGATGTRFPKGTHQDPVNNLADAIAIAESRGLDEFIIDGTLVVVDTDISGYKFMGENNLSAVIVLSGTGNTTERTHFTDMIVTGRINGAIFCRGVGLQTLSHIGSPSFPTIFERCILRADVGVTPTIQFNSEEANIDNVHFIECVSGVPGAGTSTFDLNGSDAPFALRKFGGGIAVINFNQGQASTIEIQEGQLKVDSSCTSGTLQYRGGGKLVYVSPVGPGMTISTDAATHVILQDVQSTIDTGVVDANIVQVNEVVVQGDGSDDNPWNPING